MSLVLCRLVNPNSKLKTVTYFKQHLNIDISVHSIYPFLDQWNSNEKYQKDAQWDGLKGFGTNTKLSKNMTIEYYSQLWMVEKAFRISKTDLRIRPIYHRLKSRIEAHIGICFTAYKIYKESERLLRVNKITISPEKAIAEIKKIRQLRYTLPKPKEVKTKLLNVSELQKSLIDLKF